MGAKCAQVLLPQEGGQLIAPPRSKGFLFEGVGSFLTKGSKKTPLDVR